MTEGGLLPAALLGPLSEACARGYTIVVADPFFAEALKAEMGYAQVQDLFSWASATLGVSKPDPVDLLLACREALTVIQSYKGDSLAGEWELAQRLGRDWQEVLLHTPSLREASAYWDELASHRQIQGLFSLYQDASLDWLGVLPLPQRKSDAMRVFWSCLREFLDAYQRALREKRKVLFSEEAIHRLLENPNWDRVLFLHLYSPYPLINKLLSIAYEKGVEIWGWDVKTLREHLPEVWDPLPPLTGAASWPDRVRPVSISELPSLVEVVEAAAQAVASYVRAQPTARVAVWCEEEIAFLFRHLFEREGMGAFLSPSVLPLWAGTQVGKVLAEHMGSGLRGELSAWPSVECADSPQEKWVQRVYEWVCEKAHPGEPASWQFLLAFLQTHTPILSPFSPDTRVYVGRLTQLAGGAYDAVFIIQPSEEPLGRWSRPSFWLFSLRNRFFPRERHHQLSWRLQSLLLWGSREVHIWRQAGEEFRSPLEDFLRHTKLFELDR
ncbi:MAG: hypothetical protein N2170_06940, partial [Bacteroidia bacterium]|nr:hypothetical protein [Bacteroidia bacterium]